MKSVFRMKTLVKFLSILGVGGLLWACQPTIIAPPVPEDGFEYFPLEVGKLVEYQVDSILYDPVAGGQVIIDTNTVFVREEIVEVFLGANNDSIYRIERFERPNDTTAWTLQTVWSAYRDQREAIRVEENLKFLKLRFPVRKFDSWEIGTYAPTDFIVTVEGETLEMFKGWLPTVIDIDTTLMLPNGITTDAIQVELANIENLIEKRFGLERYAKNIGLVYKKLMILDTQTVGVEPFEQRADKGFILEQRLLNYN